MIAVNEVHVRVSRRPEEHRVARSSTGIRVRRRIVDSEVGFVFDDSAGEKCSSFAADQQLAQQFASNGHRIAIEEFARKNWSIAAARSRNGGAASVRGANFSVSCARFAIVTSISTFAINLQSSCMIAHLRGRLIAKHPNQAIVETAGVGYDVTITVPTFSGLARAGQ